MIATCIYDDQIGSGGRWNRLCACNDFCRLLLLAHGPSPFVPVDSSSGERFPPRRVRVYRLAHHFICRSRKTVSIDASPNASADQTRAITRWLNRE